MSQDILTPQAPVELTETERLQEQLDALISMAHMLGDAREHVEPERRATIEETLRALGPQIQHAREQLAALGIEVAL